VLTAAGLQRRGVYVFTTERGQDDATAYSRLLSAGGIEDPATGSAAGPLGAYTVRHRVLPADQAGETTMVIEQGIEMGRPSVLRVRVRTVGHDITTVLVSGDCHRIGEGKLSL